VDLLAHPAAQSVALPLAVCLAALALSRRGRAGEGVAIALAVLATAAVVLGLAPWPPRSGLHKLPWLLALALALGAAGDLARVSRRAMLLCAWVYAAGAYAWLAWPQRASATAVEAAGGLALLAGVGVMLWRLSRRERPAAPPAVMLAMAGAGLAGVAFQSASLVIAQLAGALGVAAGAFVLWSLLRARTRFTPGAMLGAGGALALLLALTFLLTEVSAWALLALVTVFFSDGALARWRTADGFGARLAHSLAVAAVAAVPVIGAVAVASWLQPSDSPYY
jgi:hypothetical protein